MMRFVLAPLFLAALVSARTVSSPVVCNDAFCYCASKDGQNLGYHSLLESKDMKNCQCAVDKYEYQQLEIVGKVYSCDKYGNYAPVQCLGSVCYCAASTGDKIGFETPIHLTANKNCQCALDQHAYQKTGLVGKTFSCDEQGNYAPVNCIGSVCHCTTSDGKNIGYETPIHMYSQKTCQCALDKHEYQKKGLIGKTFACDEHGNYKPVNCLGSVCHCTTAEGKNIGYATPIHEISEKNCKCALDKHAYQQTGMLGKTFSCDEYGNYEAVQCLGSVCYCATSAGEKIGFETPIHLASQKTCKCALDQYAYQKTGMLGKTFSCDEHGNYAPVNCIGSVCHCTTPAGKNIGYETPIHENHVKTCKCALDKHEYEQKGLLGQSFSCDKYGNYNSLRCVGSVCFCADAFGKQVGTTTVPIGHHDQLNC